MRVPRVRNAATARRFRLGARAGGPATPDRLAAPRATAPADFPNPTADLPARSSGVGEGSHSISARGALAARPVSVPTVPRVLIAAALALLTALALAAPALAAPPTLTINPASAVETTHAHLSGELAVPADGFATYWCLEYAEEGLQNWSGFCYEGPVPPGETATVSRDLSGLRAATPYEARLSALNFEESVEEHSSTVSFTTDVAPTEPTLSIEPATGVRYTTAHISGEVDPSGGNEEASGAFVPIAWQLEANHEGEGWNPVEGGTLEGTAASTEATAVEADLTGLTPGAQYQFRLEATYAGRQALSAEEGFETEAVAAPTATIEPPAAITAHGAHLIGHIHPNAPETEPVADSAVEAAFQTTWHFECTPACPSAETTALQPADNTAHTVEADATGLEPNSDFSVRLIASNAGGSAEPSETFSTDQLAPTFTGVTMARTTTDAAQLDARVDPMHSTVECHFEWGPTSAYGHTAPCLSNTATGEAFTGAEDSVLTGVAAELTGLQPSTTYHFRLVLTNSAGGETDPDHSFETDSPYPSCPGVGQCVGVDGERTLELVSTIAKNESTPGSAKLSSDGDHVIYNLLGGVDGSDSGMQPLFRATRTSGGWVSQSALPATDQQLDAQYSPLLTTPTFDRLLVKTEGTGVFSKVSPISWALLGPGLSQTLLHTFPSFQDAEVSGAPSVAASDDLSHIFINSPEDIDPADSNATTDVYMLSPGAVPKLVSLLPDDTIPTCGVTRGTSTGFASISVSSDRRQHWVSTDGSSLFFESKGDECPEEASPRQLYRRDLLTETTSLISGSVLAGVDDGVGAQEKPGFLQAAADGSWVIYRSSSELAPADTDTTPDIYRWRLGQGNACLTCIGLTAAKVKIFAADAVASEDGTHVYFKSNARLTPDAPRSGTKLYVWRAPGELRLVAPAFTNDLSPSPSDSPSEVSPDGNLLFFANSRPGATADENGGYLQYYRYDDRDRSILCVSCPLATSAGADVSGVLAGRFSQLDSGSALSAEGGRFGFTTPDSLVRQVTNGSGVLYEWHGGRLARITSGVYPNPEPSITGISGDGRDALFTAYGRLTPDSPDESAQIYDARIGGGFPQPPNPPAACGAEDCRAEPAGAPPQSPPASSSFSGPGNPRLHCRKGRLRKHGKCVPKKHHHGKPVNKNREAANK